jgi:RimJ/RimL family protein N-acetyltransferase
MTIIVEGNNIILRDRLETDVDSFIFWQTHGEWRFLDAPWEGFKESLSMDEEADIRNRFLMSCIEELPFPRRTAIIAEKDNRPLGWINRYEDDHSPTTWMVGIAICVDNSLNKGIGTEALGLWIGYLVDNSTVHRIGLDTWSFNPRMLHVAEKLGFISEGVQREVLKWDGQWLDLIHFGILRSEWEKKRINE